MFSMITGRVIASIVGFFLGWSVFHVARPVAELPGVDRPAVQISSITLKRQGCSSDSGFTCSIYDVTFRSDGTGTFIGYKNNDDYDGKFNTVFDPRDFANMVERIENGRILELPQHYESAPD